MADNLFGAPVGPGNLAGGPPAPASNGPVGHLFGGLPDLSPSPSPPPPPPAEAPRSPRSAADIAVLRRIGGDVPVLRNELKAIKDKMAELSSFHGNLNSKLEVLVGYIRRLQQVAYGLKQRLSKPINLIVSSL